ncbi:MAG: UbiA family prenyltransferase [Thermodesulfovibrionales bacterium]
MSDIHSNTKKAHSDTPPLCVDLDGTLVITDTLWEALLSLIKTHPFMLLCLPFWLIKGKAYFKHRIATLIKINPDQMAYNDEVLAFLRSEHDKGRDIVLTTASDYQIADSIAKYLGIFSSVLASNGKVNLSGNKKLQAIRNYVGNRGYEYIGNDTADLPVWKGAKKAHLVNPNHRLLRKTKEIAAIGHIFGKSENKWIAVLKALRTYQWAKNLLIFVPLITSHRLSDIDLLFRAFIAFASFSLCASCVYIINDLMDLSVDWQHPRKRYRPFASGALSIKNGIFMSMLLLSMGLAISISLLHMPFTFMLITYIILTTAYSLSIKKIPVLDVLLLAGLYTQRILAGGIAVEITLTAWLLGFAIFFFLSLAFVKRYTELRFLQVENKTEIAGRGYGIEDIGIIQSIGPTSGYLSVLVLALYINSKEVILLYKNPWILWLIGPCLLYWITRIWLIAHRGQMHDDPIVFAIKDKVSYIVAILVVLILIAATL